MENLQFRLAARPLGMAKESDWQKTLEPVCAIGAVLESKSPLFAAGDHVSGSIGYPLSLIPYPLYRAG